jgi:hypothetical protein
MGGPRWLDSARTILTKVSESCGPTLFLPVNELLRDRTNAIGVDLLGGRNKSEKWPKCALIMLQLCIGHRAGPVSACSTERAGRTSENC